MQNNAPSSGRGRERRPSGPSSRAVPAQASSRKAARPAVSPSLSSRRPTAQATPPAPPTRDALAALARQAGLPVPDAALTPLCQYLTMLCRWNAAMNLVGARNWREALVDLAGDSFYLARFLEELPLPEDPLFWDLGAGAGLPGIPLRMAFARGSYWLVEVREKRALFLAQAVAGLELPCTHVYRGRAQDFFEEQPRGADCILSRAFMPWQELLALLAPQLASGGLVIILALQDAPGALPPGWEMLACREYVVPRLKPAAGRASARQKKGQMPDTVRRWFWALRRTDTTATLPDDGEERA